MVIQEHLRATTNFIRQIWNGTSVVSQKFNCCKSNASVKEIIISIPSTSQNNGECTCSKYKIRISEILLNIFFSLLTALYSISSFVQSSSIITRYYQTVWYTVLAIVTHVTWSASTVLSIGSTSFGAMQITASIQLITY